MELVEETYDRKKMSIPCNHMGNLEAKEFNHISCGLCDEIVLPEVKKKNKFDKSASVADIIGSWDTKKISVKYLDMAGRSMYTQDLMADGLLSDQLCMNCVTR